MTPFPKGAVREPFGIWSASVVGRDGTYVTAVGLIGLWIREQCNQVRVPKHKE